MSKALILSTVFCAAFVVGGAGATFAGEVTGNGKSLQLEGGGLHGASACAFSGLEDDVNPGDELLLDVEPGTVQSFGNHPVAGSGVAQGNIPNDPGPAAPGIFCNPSDPS